MNDNHIFKNLKHDLPAGLVVFLVAVPLCLGIALASGAPLFSGVIAGIVGGILVTIFSGSSLGVSGPAAGLAVIVLVAIEELGSYEVFLVAVMIGGAIQILLGIGRAGIIGYYFPTSVIKGMLAAIGIIIFLKQIPLVFGYDADPEGDMSFIQADGENTFSELINMINFISPGAILIASLSLGILILWEQPFIKRIKIFEIVQGPLVVVTLGIVLGMVLQGTRYGIAAGSMVNLPVSDSLAGFAGQFTLPDFSGITQSGVWVVGVTIAIVASLETLLSVEATDKLDPQKRVTPTNKELRAQGIGNMVSGLIGGLPITQVIVRSSANIQSGGKTKMASLIHGIMLLLAVLLVPNLLNKIPLASLAAVLMVVGYKLAKPSLFKEMFRKGYLQFLPFMVTIVAIVFTDLLVGIGIGMAVAIFNILIKNLKNPYVLKETHDSTDEHYRIELSEQVTFLNKAQILKQLNAIPNGAEVLIDTSKCVFIEHDVIEIIDDFRESAQYRDINLKIYYMQHLNLGHYKSNFEDHMIGKEELDKLPSEDQLVVTVPK